MDSSVIQFLSAFFSSIWSMLGSVSVPGTNLTLQHCLVAPIAVSAFIGVIKKFLDNGAVSSSSAHSAIREEHVRAEREARSASRSKG